MDSSQEKRLLLTAWFFFVIIVTAYALVTFCRTSTSTLATELMNSLHTNTSGMTAITSAFFYGYAVMQIPSGILADRWGARRSLIFALMLGAAGTLGFSLASSLPLAVFFRAIIGIGMGMIFVPGVRAIVIWFPPRFHSLCIGLYVSLGMTGMFIASSPLAVIARTVDWRICIQGSTALILLTALPIYLFFRDSPAEKGFTSAILSPRKTPAAEQISIGNAVSSIARSRHYWLLSVWFFCLWGTSFALTSLWVSPYFTQGYGLEPAQAGNILACMAFGTVVGPAAIGGLASTMPYAFKKLLLLDSFVCGLLCLLFVVPVRILPQPLLLLWGTLFGFFFGGFGCIALLIIQRLFPVSIAGTATGMANTFVNIGSGVIQYLFCLTLDIVAPGQTQYSLVQFSTAFWVIIAALVLSFLAIAFLPTGIGTKPYPEN